ncbi:unnamed protein product [Vitrella brassicaformis CCMP3155]|uniref:FCP1 homology domain-containing protein n=1 Tax=Vitrella brassicaformis (strain CCMP3155) TaxID=1169540 RepID=A0A0G4EKQ7_VITBC|nr:unnamed protein product [Vitrella brassicaformis CCMP3155]|eukprot:CEL97029.1 unnamed protein product [Vitrella brassicaformis CCMP3155]
MPANEEEEHDKTYQVDHQHTYYHYYPDPRDHTMVILDYDNTLFPTSVWRSDAFRRLLDPQKAALLVASGASAYRLVAHCAAWSRVVIVSNGKRLWLNTSLKLPGYERLRALLQDNEIPVLSAKEHAKLCGLDDQEACVWKRLCCAELLAYYHERGIMPLRVVSIGDKELDLSAIEANRRYLEEGTLLKIKLVEGPTVDELIKEHELLSTHLLSLLAHSHMENYEVVYHDTDGDDDEGEQEELSLSPIDHPEVDDPQTYFSSFDLDGTTVCRPS